MAPKTRHPGRWYWSPGLLAHVAGGVLLGLVVYQRGLAGLALLWLWAVDRRGPTVLRLFGEQFDAVSQELARHGLPEEEETT